MAIDHLKVNNVFELGKDEGTDYIILPCKVLSQNAMTLVPVVYIVRLNRPTQMHGRLKANAQMRGRHKAHDKHYLCQFL